jgi:hypothetical protein
VGEERSLYNPFGKKGGYAHPMHGLSLNKPLFLFRYDGKRLHQLFHCLVWGEPHDPEAWTVYRLDATHGRMCPLKTGRGKDAYGLAIRELAKNGITPGDIIWAPL